MKTKTEKYDVKVNDAKVEGSWAVTKKVAVHPELFKKGFIVAVPKENFEEFKDNKSLSASSFFIKERQFYIHDNRLNSNEKTEKKPSPRSVKKVNNLFERLCDFSKKNNRELEFCDTTVVHTPKHRDEIFLPLLFDGIGIYVYPWLSDNVSQLQFDGGNQFVTAGCLFGGSLQGKNRTGAKRGLIKHDIEFHPGEKITRIDYNPDKANPYEAALFDDFKKQVKLMLNLAKPDMPVNLLYHLPYYDYLLFGVELFVRERMTYDALKKLFKVIIEKRNEHVTKISEICKHYNINVRIQSPFDNLFGEIYSKENYLDEALKILNIPISPAKTTNSKDSTPPLGQSPVEEDLSIESKTDHEYALVQNCLSRLKTNQVSKEIDEFNQERLQIYRKKQEILNNFLVFLNAVKKENVGYLKDLFCSDNLEQVRTDCENKLPQLREQEPIIEQDILKVFLKLTKPENLKVLIELFDHFDKVATEIELGSNQTFFRQHDVLQTFLEIVKLDNLESLKTLVEVVRQKQEQEYIDNKSADSNLKKVCKEQQEVWQDFLEITKPESIKNLEDLFKAANAIIIGVASKGKANHQVCSVLPSSEKQIQVGYSSYRKKFAAFPHYEKKYPAVLNLTFLETVLSYSDTSDGLLFYLASSLKALHQVIVDNSARACRNIGFFARKQTDSSASQNLILRSITKVESPPSEQSAVPRTR